MHIIGSLFKELSGDEPLNSDCEIQPPETTLCPDKKWSPK